MREPTRTYESLMKLKYRIIRCAEFACFKGKQAKKEMDSRSDWMEQPLIKRKTFKYFLTSYFFLARQHQVMALVRISTTFLTKFCLWSFSWHFCVRRKRYFLVIYLSQPKFNTNLWKLAYLISIKTWLRSLKGGGIQLATDVPTCF